MNHLRAAEPVFPKSTHSTTNSFSCSSRAVKALVLVLGLLAGSSRADATNLTWTAASGTFSTAGNWDPAQAPVDNDVTIFTNDTDYTVSFSGNSPTIVTCTFTGHAGVVTLNIGSFTWTVTNQFRVGRADATSTVYLASGTISVAGIADAATASLRIGDAATNGFDCVGTLIITNGTVAIDSGVVGNATTNTGPSSGVGTLIITGKGKMISGGSGSTLTIGANTSAGSRLIVTNGGKLVVDGTLTIGANAISSNTFALFSGPTTTMTNSSQGIRMSGNGGLLIISNGAKVYMADQGTLGANSSYNTGIVVGANSELIINGSLGLQVGANSSGGTNNNLTVYDGGRLTCNGTLAFGNNVLHVNDGLNMGGTGAMSTGFAIVVRSTSATTNHFGGYVTVTNAFFSSGFLNPQAPQEFVTILAKGTWKITNSLSLTVSSRPNTNGVNMGGNFPSPGGSILTINGGTLINFYSTAENNGGGINLGGNGNISLIVTNNGKLLTSFGTIGGGTAGNTGIVAGVGSVWSNSTGVVGFTNFLIVGTGAGGSNNFFAVVDGGRFYNAGTLAIGNAGTAIVNRVVFGSAGASSTIVNDGSLNIGNQTGTYSNSLLVTNATLNCGTLNVGTEGATNNLLDFRSGTINVSFVRIRPANTVIFAAGTLSAGGLTFDTLANDGNPFFVGDGTSTASYVMTNGGTGYHNFNNGGLVVTNGASLRGNGTLVGNVTVLGTFDPGFSLGTVYCSNNLTFGSSAVLKYDLGISGGNPTGDSVNVNGDLTLGGTLNVSNSGGFAAGTYVLFTHTNTVTGTLSVGTLPPGGFGATVSNDLPTTPRILLIVTAAVSDPFTTWQTHYFPADGPNASPNADPDLDGMSNTNEFLAGFNPTNSAASLHIISIATTAGTNVTITYLGASGDSTYTGGPSSRTNVLESTAGTPPNYTNNNWFSVGAGATNILSSGTGLGQVATFVHTNGATGPARYYRVRVLLP